MFLYILLPLLITQIKSYNQSDCYSYISQSILTNDRNDYSLSNMKDCVRYNQNSLETMKLYGGSRVTSSYLLREKFTLSLQNINGTYNPSNFFCYWEFHKAEVSDLESKIKIKSLNLNQSEDILEIHYTYFSDDSAIRTS